MPSENSLHLPELVISGFRGIDELLIPRLGRVTLLAGKNSVGKTTVLDAVLVYAARGRRSALYQLLTDRQEFAESTDEDGDTSVGPDWMSLFHRRNTHKMTKIVIGPENAKDHLEIRLVGYPFTDLSGREGAEVVFRNWNRRLETRYRDQNTRTMQRGDEPPPAMICEYLRPGTLSERQLSRFWDSVALTDDEDRVRNSLDLAIGADVVRVAVVGDKESKARRAIVRLKSQDRPVSLNSLGDGAVRLFGVALALANSSGGFLLIDAVENGIHHTVQRDLWAMLLRTAHENDIQVLATTHSWDCVRGFAQAATDFEHGEGVLVRLERDDEGLRAIEYSEECLRIAAEHGIEVR